MQLSEKIQLSRKKKGLSQEDLANLLNVSRQAVQKWESGTATPEVSKLIQISNILDVSLDFLLKDIKKDDYSESVERYDEPIEESDDDDIEYKKVKRLHVGYYTVIKVFIIIGMIISPAALATSLITVLGTYSLIFLSMYVVTFSLGVGCIRECKYASRKGPLILWGIFIWVFVSRIAGILLFAISDNNFVDTKVPVKKEKVISQPIPPIEVVQEPEIMWDLKASMFLQNSVDKLHYVKDKDEKEKYKEELDKFADECPNITDEEKYSDFCQRINTLLAPVDKIIKRRGYVIAGIALGAVTVLVLSIVLPFTITKSVKQKQQREADYNELVNLINHYENANDDERIESLIKSLDGYYDLTTIKNDYKNASNYYRLNVLIRNYSGTSDDRKIQTRLNSIDNHYKKVDAIKTDFTNVKKFVAQVVSKNATNDDKTATMSVALANRSAVKNLYVNANTSKLWTFTKYVRSISVPYLIKGATCIDNNGEYGFQWWTDGEGNERIKYNLPYPSSYNPDLTYYFDTIYDRSDNSLKFTLSPTTDSSVCLDFFKIDKIGYSNSVFYCNAYLYGSASNTTLLFADE